MMKNEKHKSIVVCTLVRLSETSESPILNRYGEITETHIEIASNSTSNSSQNLQDSLDLTYPSTANFNQFKPLHWFFDCFFSHGCALNLSNRLIKLI